jgi:DNA-binding NarL/FixJ family response regulator
VAAVVFRRLATLANGRGPATGDRTLTERERQVAALIERGLSNKEIAVALGIEVPTVKNHVHHILEKLRVRRRAEAAALVRGRRRWSRPSPSRPSAPPPEI